MSWATVDKGGKPDSGPRFERYLDSGERILWTGRPAGGLILRRQDRVLVPLSIFMLGFSLFWLSDAVLSPDGRVNTVGLLFGLVLIAAVVFAVAGRFVVDAGQRRATAYAVTDRRALILRGSTLKGMPLEPFLEVSVVGHGLGSILFGQDPVMTPRAPGSRGVGPWIGPAHSFIFERIEDVDRVYRMVRETQNRQRRD